MKIPYDVFFRMTTKLNLALKSAFIGFSLTALTFSNPVFAEGGIYYFCGATTDDKKTYYYTRLFERKLEITAVRGFKDFLGRSFGQDFEDNTCFSYGSEAESVDLDTATEFWNLEVKRNSVNANAELVDWSPG